MSLTISNCVNCLQSAHQSSLQPALGRPDRDKELTLLSSHEEHRHTAALKVVAEDTQSMREKQKKFMFTFLSELSKTTKSLLQLMDSFIYSAEVTGVCFWEGTQSFRLVNVIPVYFIDLPFRFQAQSKAYYRRLAEIIS